MQIRAQFTRREELFLVLSLLLRRWCEAESDEWKVKDTNVRQVISNVVHLAQVDLEGHGERIVLLTA